MTLLDISNPFSPVLIPPPDDSKSFRILFGIADGTMPLTINALGSPDSAGHFEFQVLSATGA